MHYDVFNGDADGIISLLQLRLAAPKASTLVTGVKRDIQLLEPLQVFSQDSLTVLDISMAKNINALERVLNAGASVFYADHHQSGVIPDHPSLNANIDLDANTCTALIIDQFLNGQFHLWAITAAYGDNLIEKADSLASEYDMSCSNKALLRELGTLINYNGYGEKVQDLHYHPASLYQLLVKYPSPFDVIADHQSPYYVLKSAYEEDMKEAQALKALHQSGVVRVFELPNRASSRRISGVYGNWLANQEPSLAHAVLTENESGTYTVSLRAPLNNKQGAGDICGQFLSGGGRAAAGGINQLDNKQLALFIEVVESYYK